MKGIIIAAGYGTRFLPCTKTIPKEMFPLIDTPAIDFIIDEFIQSGITDILIVSSRRKKVLEDYFDREIELEYIFSQKNEIKKLEKIEPVDANVYFLRQKKMLGTGHAILICKNFIGNEPFVVAYPDDIVFSDIPLTKQLMDVHEKTGGSVLSTQIIEGDVSRYGVLDYTKQDNGLLQINEIIEKPAPGTEPSKMISIGRFLLTPKTLSVLEKDFKKHTKGEFYHITAINEQAAKGEMFACNFTGERIDVGDKLGYLDAIIKYGLSRDDLKNETQQIIKKYYNSIK